MKQRQAGESAFADDRSRLFGGWRRATASEAGESEDGRKRKRDLLHWKCPRRIAAKGRDSLEATPDFFMKSIGNADSLSRSAFHDSVTHLLQCSGRLVGSPGNSHVARLTDQVTVQSTDRLPAAGEGRTEGEWRT
ncbi:MAG TPA: hypothetical protein VGO06_20480 [Bosea sp. (in: a-proteobacteria)]|uniref:hypothetical protein n=1 Tax=Bosea sp. (in: a-proteobacteria) TaxID=1871050 RepID=UPI002E15A37D|nr:hypothetical protein [Bosea sp. (in: a-proteobacteria)]